MRVFAALVPCLCMVLSINALSRSSIVIIRGGKDVPKTRETKAEQVGLLVTLKKVIQQLRRLFFPSWNNIQPSSKTAQKKADATDSSQNRIQKELRNFMASPPHNCEVSVGKNIRVWVVTLTGVEGTVYEGEKYKLKFVFPKEYPSRPPGVYFLKPTPKHQHVYSNGDICLNLLGKDWRPMMTAESIAVSILSMLSSAKEKKTPQDNAMHADNAPGQRQENWMYHDDKC